MESAHASRRLRRHRRLAVLITGIGLVLMVRQMYFDSEPGAISLLLIISGIAWFLITRARSRSNPRQP
jgi:nicotinamide riboside transporter PnuC